MTENDWGSIINYMENLGIVLDKLPDKFSSLNNLSLKEVLTQAIAMGQKTWVLQSYLLKHAADVAGPKLRNKAIVELAKEVGIARTKAYGLIRINEEILQKDFNVTTLDFIGISHFLKIVNLIDTIKKQKLDPIKLLEDASENSWTVSKLESIITGTTPIEYEEVWYEAKVIKQPLVDSTKNVSLNTYVDKYEDNNKIYLKVKQIK